MTCGCDQGPFTTVEGDTPVLRDALTENDAPMDLTDATVVLTLVHRLYGARVTKTPTVVSPATDGYVDTLFTTTDLQAGEYDYRYTVTRQATVLSVPSDGVLSLSVGARL